jgi:hypothetical protein
MSFVPVEFPMVLISLVKSICKLVSKLFMNLFSIANRITDRIFCQYFSENSRTIHFSIALLITVLYKTKSLMD